MFIHSVVPSKTIADSRPKWAKCISFFRKKNGSKTLPDGAAHTDMAYIREYPPPGQILSGERIAFFYS